MIGYWFVVIFAAGVLNGNAHGIHLHGHHLQVIKIGWPQYDSKTKIYQDISSDLDYNQSTGIITWSNSSWSAGHVPGVVESRAPLKDTLAVPVGGYVVTRLKAENPGMVIAPF